MQARYDAYNPPALKRLVAGGTQLPGRSPHPSWMRRRRAANEVYAETSASNAAFKKVYDSMVTSAAISSTWWQVAEYSFDSF